MATRTVVTDINSARYQNHSPQIVLEELDEGPDDSVFSATPPQYNIEEASDVMFALLILAQAAQDALLPTESVARLCARAYLTNWSEGLEIICDSARVNVEYLIRVWVKRLGAVTPFPEGYDEMYKKDHKWKARQKATGADEQKATGADESSVSSGLHLDGPSGDVPVAPGSEAATAVSA